MADWAGSTFLKNDPIDGDCPIQNHKAAIIKKIMQNKYHIDIGNC